ncbi:glycoside hydrolase family 15 protein, partial [Pseudomonas syringae pv. actinidiae]|nr:glycoside hydrolase family 15 protein [Pseudomonas syringae pv. actinidiae]
MADRPQEAQNRIEDHGIIGDMRSAALIADTGSIDFCCWPDFDSPSIFTALLDTPDAGIFQLAPDLPDARRLQIYLPDTNVLQTPLDFPRQAVVEVTDLMPIGEDQDDLPRIVRRVQVRFGEATIRMRCRVRMDYSRADTTARVDGEDICFEAEGQPGMRLSAATPLHLEQHDAVAELHMHKG